MESLTFLADLKKRNDQTYTPEWSSKVERWYQLDEMGFSFCEALLHWKYLENFKKPDFVMLAIDGASNFADQEFVLSGMQSPAKFVYTLPNISAAIIFKMLGFNRKVFCICDGPRTLDTGLTESQALARDGKVVWFFGSRSLGPDSREVFWVTF